MVNDAFFAVSARDELRDTMYFGGFDYKYNRLVVAGKKVYEFTCPEFTLKIIGRMITVNSEKFRRVADAKYYIQMEFVNV